MAKTGGGTGRNRRAPEGAGKLDGMTVYSDFKTPYDALQSVNTFGAMDLSVIILPDESGLISASDTGSPYNTHIDVFEAHSRSTAFQRVLGTNPRLRDYENYKGAVDHGAVLVRQWNQGRNSTNTTILLNGGADRSTLRRVQRLFDKGLIPMHAGEGHKYSITIQRTDGGGSLNKSYVKLDELLGGKQFTYSRIGDLEIV